MTKQSAEQDPQQPVLARLNDIGRCATCPSRVGVEIRPVAERDGRPATRACRDLRVDGVSEYMPAANSAGYQIFHEEYAVCARDEIPTQLGPISRTLSWAQVGHQLLNTARDVLGITEARMRGDVDPVSAALGACAGLAYVPQITEI